MKPKIYTRRDSALKALKKAGVKTEDYDKYLRKTAKGFLVNLPGKGEKAPTEPKKKSKKKAAAKKPAGEKKASVASRIRELIKQGKDNKQVWAIVKPEFKLDDNKKHYPGWYRSQMNRDDA